MCLPCDVLNYLVSTEFKTTTGCLLCVLPVSHTLVRLKHVCIFHKKRHTGRWHCREAYRNIVRTKLLAKSWDGAEEANWYEDTHHECFLSALGRPQWLKLWVYSQISRFFFNSIMLPDPSEVSLTAAMPRRQQIPTVLRRLAGKLRGPHH